MGIDSELSWTDQDLLMFPQRAFEFEGAGTVVIDQDVADVGSVVWDAEVVLAHYLDRVFGPKLRGKRVLELGAGTGLAGIVAARHGAFVMLTEQPKLLPSLTANARNNLPPGVVISPGEAIREGGWGWGWGWDSPRGASEECPGAGEEEDSLAVGGIVSDTGQSEVSHPPGVGVWPEEERPGSGQGQGLGLGLGLGLGPTSATVPCQEGVSVKVVVAELLFSEDAEEVRQTCADATVPRGGQRRRGRERNNGMSFDLVVGADIVYLEDLWDAMAGTVKALLHPKGLALMSFEKRRRNMAPFFHGGRRFPAEHFWKCREEESFLSPGAAPAPAPGEGGEGPREEEEEEEERAATLGLHQAAVCVSAGSKTGEEESSQVQNPQATPSKPAGTGGREAGAGSGTGDRVGAGAGTAVGGMGKDLRELASAAKVSRVQIYKIYRGSPDNH